METTIKKKKVKLKALTAKKFNHDVSIFKGELGLVKEDLAVLGLLLHFISTEERYRVDLFDSKAFKTQTTNLYRVKYKLEAILHHKAI